MKIGILTHYQVESHGAVLQHYALTEYLRQAGHEVYTLSYPKSLDFARKDEQKKFSVGLGSVSFYVKEYLLKLGVSFVWTMARKHFLLQDFNKKHFQFLPYAQGDLDLAIVGSDEVWSLQLGANMMMYGHGVDAKRCLAYAPSFGQTNVSHITQRNCKALIRSGLESFSALSVRDLGSADIVRELTGREPMLVCDPVLLYGFEKELAAYHPMTNEKYVVVYAYNSNLNEPDRVEQIRAYARSIGAKVYSVGAFHKWCDKQIACDPIEMLYWFKGAEAVFTDTFHGTITAYLGETPMAVYVRETNNVKLDHLLQVLGLEHRKVTKDRTIQEILAEPIDFARLQRSFAPFRQASGKWLQEQLDKEN